ncbi:MAG: phosphatidylglycerophosphatase A [Gammaproteobacteria bacterium]|nr:phosphatidylglycerophosphatase A [Gammaproteobacteria bacterium]MDP2142350.1 phosphatidylglycerophosphatase A [Gammaproteobacteria bacterium]MDP2348591.1 phosphatidylglycerophosphatase A [Gammaproteobacteria bacterium]
MPKLTPASVWRNPIHFAAFGFGSGAVPVAPGTFGTLMAVALYLLLPAMSWLVYLLFLLATFALGVWLCGKTAQDIGVHDHGGIVWDEFVGYWITMFLAPAGWGWIVAGFVLFRLFDILKPWPISWLDRHVDGGLGVMIDDVLAGVMACICLQVAAYFFS